MLKRSWPAGRSAHRPSGGAAHAETFGAIQRLYSFIGSIVMPASCRTFCKFISLKNNVLAYCIPYLQ